MGAAQRREGLRKSRGAGRETPTGSGAEGDVVKEQTLNNNCNSLQRGISRKQSSRLRLALARGARELVQGLDLHVEAHAWRRKDAHISPAGCIRMFDKLCCMSRSIPPHSLRPGRRRGTTRSTWRTCGTLPQSARAGGTGTAKPCPLHHHRRHPPPAPPLSLLLGP